MTTKELPLAEPPTSQQPTQAKKKEAPAPLHPGTDPPLAPEAIARWIAPQIAERLERAVWWPEHPLEEDCKFGDFSGYAITFAAHGFKQLIVRVVSEPDTAVYLDVSAGKDDATLRAAAPDKLRAALAAAGFRPGGARAGYCKRVLVESREDCQALAVDIAGLVTGCLGYDGREPLQHVHQYCSRTKSAAVFTALTLGDVERLLRSSKLVVGERDRRDGPGFRTVAPPAFVVAACQETWPGSGWYRALRFRYSTAIEDELAEHVIEVLGRRRGPIEMKAADDRLRLEQTVLVEGVTEEHLRAQLRHWHGFVASVAAGCRRMQAESGDK
jgi:hypothetical protein